MIMSINNLHLTESIVGKSNYENSNLSGGFHSSGLIRAHSVPLI